MWRLLLAFWRASAAEEVQYRANFLADGVTSLLTVAWNVGAASVFFGHTGSVAGWRFGEVLAVMGYFQVMMGFIEVFLRPNLGRLVEYVRLGTLDLILLKPVNAQLFVSARYAALWRGLDVLLGFGLLGVAIGQLDVPVTPSLLLRGGLLLASALAITYALTLMVMTLSFWLVQVENLLALLLALWETGRYPVQVYSGSLRWILTFALPVGLVTTVPAEAVVRSQTSLPLWLPVAVAALLLLVATAFWRFALDRYTSAGG